MVTESHRVFGCAANFLRGRKCVFCGLFRVNRTRRGYIKCRTCRREKSLAKLRREIAILQGFYQQVPAYRLAHDLGIDPKVISRVYQKVRTALSHVVELAGMASKLSGEIEPDEAYFGGRRKGRRGARSCEEKCRLQAPGAGWTGLYEGCCTCVGGSPPGPYSTYHSEKVCLLHGCVSRLSIVAALWQTSHGQSQ